MFNPKVLSILSLCILCVAGFVTYKNKNAYEAEVAARGEAEQALKISQNRHQEAVDSYNDTLAEDEQVQGEIKGLLDDEQIQKDLNAGLEKDLRDKTQQLEYFENNPDIANEQRDKVRIAENSMDEIRGLDKELKELDTMIGTRQGNLDGLAQKDQGLEGNINALKDHIESRSGGRSVDGLKTSIRAVYNSWGFVTLNHGDKTGVVLNSTLDVVRGGEIIAKLLVTIVEQNTASADIIPGSMKPGTTLMIGDKVVPASTGIAAN